MDNRAAGRWYTFVPSPAYRRAAREFDAVAASHDPEALAAFVHAYPGHAPALLQLADVCKHYGQIPQATELVARALHRLEVAAHPRWAPWTGQV